MESKASSRKATIIERVRDFTISVQVENTRTKVVAHAAKPWIMSKIADNEKLLVHPITPGGVNRTNKLMCY